MKELNVWAMSGGVPSECVTSVKNFQEYLGVPAGFHWHNWHKIPFDNDYPHYFPAKEGFAQGVADLQQSQVFVMPYINGRLWDSHDRGAEDFDFTRLALAAATKDATNKPFLESYGLGNHPLAARTITAATTHQETQSLPARFERQMVFPPRQAFVLELSW